MEESWVEEVMFVGGGELGSEVSAGNPSGFASVEDFLKCVQKPLLNCVMSEQLPLLRQEERPARHAGMAQV